MIVQMTLSRAGAVAGVQPSACPKARIIANPRHELTSNIRSKRLPVEDVLHADVSSLWQVGHVREY